MPNLNEPSSSRPPSREEEHQGPIWKHPYLLYVILTVGLFLFLILMAWLAWKNGWIPNRGVAR